ncbi:MAG: family 20 glycosylhydrolase [Candidatus Hodarchaeota archaeon]
MEDRIELIFPQPKQLKVKDGLYNFSGKIMINLDINSKIIPNNLISKVQDIFIQNNFETEVNSSKNEDFDKGVTLILNEILFNRPESYKLIVDSSGLIIIGSDFPGLNYGIVTFKQIFDLYGENQSSIQLPYVTIQDWPDFYYRGIMLDVSRDKVPTMETLYDLIDLLSTWKINQIQLYFEHVFAYKGHEVVWKEASPFTSEEIIALDEFCRDRYIELVPNQNSFGHFHRWLIHDPYRPLAECPEGYAHPFSEKKEPFSLNPIDPQSLELLDDLFNQLLPNFTSNQFNVGLDETFDLGEGKSAKKCQEIGKGEVYLEFLLQIYYLARKYGKTMQFWADIIFQYPDLIEDLPKDIIPLLWGYESDYPFDHRSETLDQLGLSYYVCPGTSSWNSVAGRTDNAFENLKNAARNGKENSALGYLITDWGDHGHLQPLPVSYLGFLAGAGLSWNSESDFSNFVQVLNVYAFQDRTEKMGSIAYDLGNVYKEFGSYFRNNSGLFLILIFCGQEAGKMALKETSIENLKKLKAVIMNIISPLETVRIERKDSELVKLEYQWIADVLKFACDLGIAQLKSGIEKPLKELEKNLKEELRETLSKLIERHQEIWLQRNRSGGLIDSLKRLKRIIKLLK